jgi:beta-N-acetylhexosaminidase
MTAHIVVRALADEPATLSREALQTLLREELGFRGLAVTDALEMRAVSATVGVEEGAVRALEAGADALCLGRDLGPAEIERIQSAVVEAVRAGRLPEERLQEAAGRIGQPRAGRPGAAARGPRRREVGAQAARRALRVEGALGSPDPALVVELRPEPSQAAGDAGRGLGDALRARNPDWEVVRLREAPGDAAALLGGHGRSRLVVVAQDAHRHRWQRDTLETLLRARPDVIVVETGLPVWRPERASRYLATYGAGPREPRGGGRAPPRPRRVAGRPRARHGRWARMRRGEMSESQRSATYLELDAPRAECCVVPRA